MSEELRTQIAMCDSGVLQNNESRPVYIVDMARTPFIKSQNEPGPFSAADLAVSAVKPLLMRQPFQPSELDEVVVGCMIPSSEEANIARIIALRSGCGKKVPAYTVQRNCASGLQAIDSGMKDILMGRSDLVLVGGTEAMSRSPLQFNAGMTRWFSKQFKAKTLLKKLGNLLKFRPAMLAPEVALLKGLTDPTSGFSMGQTAEELAFQFDISREKQDQYAVMSHQRALEAMDLYGAIEPLYGEKLLHAHDNGVREDSSIEKLAKLKPFFDKTYGSVTPGNSSQISDGAAFLILASEAAVKQYGLAPLATIEEVSWSGVEPETMGLGPVHAMAKILMNQQLSLDAVDCFEINEAFAAQVLACKAALKQDSYCQQHFERGAFGSIPLEKLNQWGGAIALGHPVGASGARITMQLLEVLQQQQKHTGLASLCIGGGQGGAILLKRMGVAA